MSTTEKSKEKVDAIENDAFRVDMDALPSAPLPNDFLQANRQYHSFKRQHLPGDFVKMEENEKKLKEKHDRNVRFIEEWRELFPVPATCATCGHQMAGENDRVAAFEILLEKLTGEIDADAFGAFHFFS